MSFIQQAMGNSEKMIKLTPQEAWVNHLKEPSKNPKWMEDSNDISDELPISKRELFGLLILARIANQLSESDNWFIAYDPNASEPNDGLISDGTNRDSLWYVHLI